MNKLITKEIQSNRALMFEIVKDLHQLTIDIGHKDLATTVSDLRDRVHEPFMFVIVGEVKAGKSSFINALLETGREITKVAPQPMTDTIQQIIYGDEEEIVPINPYLKKILLPVDILREIAIVDTPGTNTIIEHHQEITESFIPASDLIVFVFEAKNPYRQSAWEFFDYIHSDWRKKIIFILQQKDLINDEDLAVNMNGVKEHAVKKGITEPAVFAVSAKTELEGDKENSGFSDVRTFIQEHITGGKAPFLKLQNNITTCANINERINGGLVDRREQWEADVAFRKDIHETLDQQERSSFKQVNLMVENIVAGYDRITMKKEKELSSGLSFFSLLKRSVSSIFSKKTSPKDWLEGFAADLELKLDTELKGKLNEGVMDVAESIQQMAKMIDLKIRNSQSLLRNDHEIFSNIAEKRANVLKELQDTFSDFMNRSENFTDEELFPDKSSLSPNIATGSGLAVIGIVLTAVTQGAVFDITGGVLTTIGLLFAGLTTRRKRRKIISGFDAEIAKGRLHLEEQVSEKLKVYIQNIKKKIDANFRKFDGMIEKETGQIEELENRQKEISQRLVAMGENISLK